LAGWIAFVNAFTRLRVLVIDSMDRVSRYDQALNLHRVVGVSLYRPGGLLLAP
jgi:hypothetical protein